MTLRLKTYQVGSDRNQGDGLRIGTVRFLPRGVPKKDHPDYFDVWLPTVAPSRDLLRWLKENQAKGRDLETLWPGFQTRYEREMLKSTDSRQSILLLAQTAARTPIAVGCYCENEQRCHRSLLEALIRRAAAGKL